MSDNRCFNSNNDEDPSLFPCDPDGDLKSCCAAGDTCASNGICLPPEGSDTLTPYFLVGCTVDSWDDDSCPKNCLDSGGVGLTVCGDGKYCCYGLGGCDCDDSDVTFSLGPVRIVTEIPTDAASLTSTVVSTTAAAATTTTISSSDTTQTADTQTTTAAASDDGDDGGSGGSTIGLGVGLGIGIPLLIAVIVGAVFLFKRRSKPGNGGEHYATPQYASPEQAQYSTPDQSQYAMPQQQMAAPYQVPGHQQLLPAPYKPTELDTHENIRQELP